MKLPKQINLKRLLKEQPKLRCVPQEGTDFIAYKMVRYYTGKYYTGKSKLAGWGTKTKQWRAAILVLYIPVDAQRRNGETRRHKARFSRVFVLGALGRDNKKLTRKKFFSIHNEAFRWNVGEWHQPARAFSPGKDICASGLHAYLSKQQAKRYSRWTNF